MMSKKYISLTFDDGPTVGITDQVLDILEEYGIRASFFIIGQQVNDDNKYLMKRAYDLGCSIENHSWTHSFMDKLTAQEVTDEIERTTKLIVDVVGETPRFFRPPYIVYDQQMYDCIDLGFICGYGCNDWEPDMSKDNRVKTVCENAKDGQIVLLHDMQDNQQTVDAIKEIIPRLLDEGYEFVNIRELFANKGVTPKRNVTYMCTDEVRVNYQ